VFRLGTLRQTVFVTRWPFKKFKVMETLLKAPARRVLVQNKFLRHVGARDLFCYVEEHVTCKKYISGSVVYFKFFNLTNYVKKHGLTFYKKTIKEFSKLFPQ